MPNRKPLRKLQSQTGSTFASKVKTARQAEANASTGPQAETLYRGGGLSGNWRTAGNGNAYLVQGGYVATVFYDEARDTWGLTLRSRQRFSEEDEAQAEAERLLDLLESE